MKAIKLIILIFCTHTSFVNAQAIISYEQYSDYLLNRNSIPEDVREVRDLNNTFNKFLGSWGGIHNNKTILFNISIKEVETYGVTEDLVELRFSVIDVLSGVILEDSTGTPLNVLSNSWSEYLIPDGTLAMFYIGGRCSCNGTFYVTPVLHNGNYDQLDIQFVEHPEIIDDYSCPSGPVLNSFSDNETFILNKI